MSRILKKKYKETRKHFRAELYEKAKENKALAVLMIETYTAWHHRRHIGKIWGMFVNPEYRNFQQEYNRSLFGEYLSGSDDIWKSLYFAEREIYDKYHREIPELFAMGDALSVAYQAILSNAP